jgi:hypothetical protein
MADGFEAGESSDAVNDARRLEVSAGPLPERIAEDGSIAIEGGDLSPDDLGENV